MRCKGFSFAVFVALLGALASGCTDAKESTTTFSAESTLIEGIVPADPSKGEFQVSKISVSPSADTTLREGDSMQISFQFWCRPGLWYGLVYIRDDGAVLTDNSVSECQDQEKPVFFHEDGAPIKSRIAHWFTGTSFSGRLNANGRVYRFMRGHQVRPELATTYAPAEWFSGNGYTLRSGIVPPTTWVIE